MKKFIIHTILFISCMIISISIIFSMINGYADPFYKRISSAEKTNLILGTSKAAQGIQPKVLNPMLNKEFYNFSFTNQTSPYGEVYYNRINQKLDKQKKNSIFILEVDVWSLSTIAPNHEDLNKFRETESFLKPLKSVNQSFNIEYLIFHFNGKYFNILAKESRTFLHDDGWLEVFIEDDKEKVIRRTNFTINDYKSKVNTYKFSDIRLQYLIQTIDLLNNYGEVHLVRLPVSPDLMKIENSISPDFDIKIQPAIQKSKAYYDLTKINDEMQFTDGVHLRKDYGKKVSEIITSRIQNQP